MQHAIPQYGFILFTNFQARYKAGNFDSIFEQSLVMSRLKAYEGTFGKEQLFHLLRRCLFGITAADAAHFKDKSLSQALDILLTPAPAPPVPINIYNNDDYKDPDVPELQPWVEARVGNKRTEKNRIGFLKSWWIDLMVSQKFSLTEKMTLFWSNHFSTEMKVVMDSRYGYRFNNLLRKHAFGNFKKLLRDVSTEPQMLVYLNGNTNVKSQPNENYGRELQELFAVGKNADGQYTEDDVRAAARVLTGWKDDKVKITSFFDAENHDTSDKQFSSFYNNRVIKGRTGSDGALELDELIDMICGPVSARFITRKLYRWFVNCEIDERIEKEVIVPLAETLVAANFEIAPVLKELFGSEHFYDKANIGCMIKSPTDFLMGAMRTLEMDMPKVSDAKIRGTMLLGILLEGLMPQQMDIGDPPNVAGWPAYRLEPQYYKIWINSQTLVYRNYMVDSFSSPDGLGKDLGYALRFDFLKFTSQLAEPHDAEKLIAEAVELITAVPLGPSQTAYLKNILLSGQTSDYYWNTAWNDYIKAPKDEKTKSVVENRLRPMYSALLQQAEFQVM